MAAQIEQLGGGPVSLRPRPTQHSLIPHQVGSSEASPVLLGKRPQSWLLRSGTLERKKWGETYFFFLSFTEEMKHPTPTG